MGRITHPSHHETQSRQHGSTSFHLSLLIIPTNMSSASPRCCNSWRRSFSISLSSGHRAAVPRILCNVKYVIGHSEIIYLRQPRITNCHTKPSPSNHTPHLNPAVEAHSHIHQKISNPRPSTSPQVARLRNTRPEFRLL